MYAPSKTPPEVLKRVAEDLGWALEQPDVLSGLEKVGVIAQYGPGEALRAVMVKDVQTVEDLVRRGVMKPGS